MLDDIARIESSVRGYVRSFPAVFSAARGARLIDHEGRSYLDFFAGAGSLNYGHNNPRAKRALLEYIQRDGVQMGLDMATEAKVGFLRDLERVILRPRGLEYKIQFTGPTGTNAVEAAIKLARKCKQRSHVVAFTGAYHGHSLGALALTANQFYHDTHYGAHQNVTHLPYDGYLGDGFDTTLLLERMLRDPSSGLPLPAAIILETVQGEGGVNVAGAGWVRRVADLCQEFDILLVIDDIQVGNGRTGHFFSFEPFGIRPDLVCLSKSIGGGLPMSLLLIHPECDVWQPGEHTGTFRGNNLAFVAGRALLEYWEDDRLQRAVANHGLAIEASLKRIASRYPERKWSVRGRGMIWGLDTRDGELAAEISREAFRRGLIVETAGPEGEVVKLLPPLTIQREELLEGLEILERAVATCLGDDLCARSIGGQTVTRVLAASDASVAAPPDTL